MTDKTDFILQCCQEYLDRSGASAREILDFARKRLEHTGAIIPKLDQQDFQTRVDSTIFLEGFRTLVAASILDLCNEGEEQLYSKGPNWEKRHSILDERRWGKSGSLPE